MSTRIDMKMGSIVNFSTFHKSKNEFSLYANFAVKDKMNCTFCIYYHKILFSFPIFGLCCLRNKAFI